MFFDRMERAGRYLSDQQANEFAAACTRFIRGYDKLARLCVQNHVSRFKLIPKMHICRHLAEDIVRFEDNIKHHHCYKDEDCVGIMKPLACKVHVGSLMGVQNHMPLASSCILLGARDWVIKNMGLHDDILPQKRNVCYNLAPVRSHMWQNAHNVWATKKQKRNGTIGSQNQLWASCACAGRGVNASFRKSDVMLFFNIFH